MILGSSFRSKYLHRSLYTSRDFHPWYPDNATNRSLTSIPSTNISLTDHATNRSLTYRPSTNISLTDHATKISLPANSTVATGGSGLAAFSISGEKLAPWSAECLLVKPRVQLRLVTLAVETAKEQKRFFTKRSSPFFLASLISGSC